LTGLSIYFSPEKEEKRYKTYYRVLCKTDFLQTVTNKYR